MHFNQFTVLLAFEEESAKSAVPGRGGQICSVSQDMGKHSTNLELQENKA